MTADILRFVPKPFDEKAITLQLGKDHEAQIIPLPEGRHARPKGDYDEFDKALLASFYRGLSQEQQDKQRAQAILANHVLGTLYNAYGEQYDGAQVILAVE